MKLRSGRATHELSQQEELATASRLNSYWRRTLRRAPGKGAAAPTKGDPSPTDQKRRRLVAPNPQIQFPPTPGVSAPPADAHQYTSSRAGF